MTSLPSGMILVLMMPQIKATNTQPQVKSAAVGSGTRHDDQTTVTSNVSGQKSNQVRAANFLQLVNGNYVLRNSTFKLSSNLSERMSVQSFKHQSNCKGNLWIDSGTNVSAMERSFKMIEETERFANMTGIHEASYLEKNEGSLLSTNQSCEAGIWLADVLCHHDGDQRLVAPVENSEEMLDMDLEVKDGLLAIKY
eukprot:6962400-Ditylum_brightwellii.AAC.1